MGERQRRDSHYRRDGEGGPRRLAERFLPAPAATAALPSMNALNAQPYKRSPPRSLATTGITVTTASASDATKVTVRTRPAVSARVCGAQSPRSRPSFNGLNAAASR